MAINDKRLSVTEFDFDDVKDNLKTFETKHPLKYQIMVNKGYIKSN